jgi:hypothetical protein
VPRLVPSTPREGRYVAALYRSLAQAIEDAIAALDAFDGDPDLELEPDLEDGADEEACNAASTVVVMVDLPPGFDPARPYAELPRQTI